MEHDDFYKILRKKITAWANSKTGKENRWLEFLLAAPDLFHLLCALILDPDIPAKHKAKLGIAIAYFVSPIDLIPEAVVGPLGYLDDIAVSAYVLNDLINEVDPEIVKKHWAGDKDILKLIKHILEVIDEMIGSGLWEKLKKIFI